MDTYKATNTKNGKFYIGSTVNFEERKKCHLRSKEEYPFQRALRRDPDAFSWEVWSDDSDEPVLEQALLDMWFGKEQCYNLNPIANRPPDNSKNEISNEKRRKAKLGTKQPQKVKDKISEQLTGRKRPEISGERHPFYGKGVPGASERMKGTGNPMYGKYGSSHPRSKKIKITYPEGRTEVFLCAKEAAEVLQCDPTTLRGWAQSGHSPQKGKFKSFTFSYV